MLLVLWMICFVTSCQNGIKFDPRWYKADHKRSAIVDRDGNIVYADNPKFSNFACMHKEKIKELAEILHRAKLPAKTKLGLENKLPYWDLE